MTTDRPQFNDPRDTEFSIATQYKVLDGISSVLEENGCVVCNGYTYIPSSVDGTKNSRIKHEDLMEAVKNRMGLRRECGDNVSPSKEKA